MTLLDCAKLPDFVLVKCPGLAAIHQEGHKALIVYRNFGIGHASQTQSCADGHKNTMLLGCEKQVPPSQSSHWFRRRAEEAERHSQEKNYREIYATLNNVYGPRSRSTHPVKSKDGELLTAPDKIKDIWIEHFSDLLNQPTTRNILYLMHDAKLSALIKLRV